METRHIRLDYREALNAKKQLLSSQLNILHVIRKIKTYRLVRRKEFAYKNKLKTNLTSLRSSLNLILSSFPEEEKAKFKIPRRLRKERIETKENIKSELKAIENKLKKLQ